MSAWKSSTARNSKAEATHACLLGEAVRGFARWKKTFKPCTLGFFALALAVVVWGYGYKLSLYFTTPDSQDQIPAAKLWIEHRNGYPIDFQIRAERQLRGDQHWHSTSMLVAGLEPDFVSVWSPFVPSVHPAAALISVHSSARFRAPPSS